MMRIVHGAATWLAGLLWATGAAAQSPIDTAQARRYFEEARVLTEAWPVPLYGPMLFADRATRAVVANEADPDGMLEPAGEVWAGTLPEGIGIANTAVEFAGRRWTMVVWPLPAGRYERARLMGHELFHRIQPELGIAMADPGNAHLDRLDGRLWLRLEWRALAAALGSTGDARRSAIADALAFRAHRRSLVEGAAAEENALEGNEGLSEYTGLVSTGLPRPVLLGWALVSLEQSDARAAGSSVTRSFAYASGPAYGLLLDDSSVGWRERVSGADLGALLAEAYGVAASSSPAARASVYDGARLMAEEQAREEVRVAALERDRARYETGATLTLPVAGEFGYSFNPNDARPFGDGTVYGRAEVRGAWGVLEVTGGVLLRRGEAGITGVVVPAPADVAARPLAGDGWTLRLAEGWTLVPGARPGDWTLAPG